MDPAAAAVATAIRDQRITLRTFHSYEPLFVDYSVTDHSQTSDQSGLRWRPGTTARSGTRILRNEAA